MDFYIVLLIVIVIFLIYSSISSKIDNKKAAKQKAEIEAQMISQGKISAGYSSDYTGEYYYAVVSNLKEQGFTNIETKKLNDGDIFDEIFGNKKENTVESISIAGKSYFRPDDYFNPNDKILICYH